MEGMEVAVVGYQRKTKEKLRMGIKNGSRQVRRELYCGKGRCVNAIFPFHNFLYVCEGSFSCFVKLIKQMVLNPDSDVSSISLVVFQGLLRVKMSLEQQGKVGYKRLTNKGS